MNERGFLPLGRPFGVRLRVHVLIVLGALFFTGFRFEPGAWLGFFLVILLHEAGHALLVRRYGLPVEGIDLHAFGGVCHWSGATTSWQRAVIAWGGVLAQLVLLGAVLVYGFFAGPPQSRFSAELVSVFTTTNLWLIGLNLLPFAPLDGAHAWSIVPELRARLSAIWSDRGAKSLWPARGAGRARRVWRRSAEAAPKLSPEEAARVGRAFEDAVRRER